MARLIFSREKYISKLVVGKKVLDVGCVNHSLMTRNPEKWLHGELKKSAGSLTGLDYVDEEVKQLQQEGFDVVCADATSFDIGQQFDFIIAGDILEHLVRPGDFLDSCRRHLKSDGQLILTTPNANCTLFFVENLILGHELDNNDHVCIYTPQTINKLLEKCGWNTDKFVFESRLLAYYKKTVPGKIAAYSMWIFNTLSGYIRPSLSRHFITIASPNKIKIKN